MRVLEEIESWWPPGPLLPAYLWYGDCFICGQYLSARHTKVVEKYGGRCACLEHLDAFRGPNSEFLGFTLYSDG